MRNCRWVEYKEYMYRGVARIFSEVRAILQIALPPPSGPPPPEEKKTTTAFPNYRFGYVVSLRVFSAFEMTLATYKIICRVFGSID